MRGRILIALAAAAALAGCQESGFDESRETQRPLKVQHALDPLTGTKVPGMAERPVTLTDDTLGDTLALGVRPVRAALSGVRMPDYLRRDARGVELLPSSPELDLAGIEAAEPDLILGTKEGQGTLYKDLRRIAPTVMSEGYNWKLNLRLHGEALGRTNDAEKLLVDWDNRVAKVKDVIGGRNVSIVLSARERELSTGPDSFAGMILTDAGIKLGTGGDLVLHVTGGPEWFGVGGLLAARAALSDLARAL